MAVKYQIAVFRDNFNIPIRDNNGRIRFIKYEHPENGKSCYASLSSENQLQYVDKKWIVKHINQIVNVNMTPEGQIYADIKKKTKKIFDLRLKN